MKASLLPPRTNSLSGEELKAYFVNAWELYEWLFSAIRKEEYYYHNPDPLRHPLIFYLGHTAAFYVNKLKMAGLISEGINAHYEEIFAKGVDPQTVSELEKRAGWPALEEVRSYREKAYELVIKTISDITIPSSVSHKAPFWALLMAIEHDRIHFETSSMLIRQYPVEWLNTPPGWAYAPQSLKKDPEENAMLPVSGGTVVIGKPESHPTFGWDNEYGALEVAVKPFLASKYLTSNAEFLSFIEEGGYENQAYWTKEGWEWKQKEKVLHPRFWKKVGVQWQYRAMFDWLPLPLQWPAEVNCHEATAYCKSKGLRLPTEAEFVQLVKQPENVRNELMENENYLLNLRKGSPEPVHSGQPDARGLYGLRGNLWQWLKDDFYPLPQFKAHALYEDFSAPYFDDKHAMLLGGSWATTGTAVSRFYRLWFRRHFFQHAGFRTVKEL